MRAVVQRVKKASVTINEKVVSSINKGLLILLGIENSDNIDDINWLVKKVVNLRIFPDKKGVMNLSLHEFDGEILIVSQFTLHASIKKGNRPYYGRSADPDIAIPLYNTFLEMIKSESKKEVKTGEFGAMMDVKLINYGPVTIIIDTKNIE